MRLRGTRDGSARNSATSNAARCGAGTSPTLLHRPLRTNRSTQRTTSRASAPLGRASSTRSPRSRASSIPASHNVVFPIPASPASTSARLRAPIPAKSDNTASSASRPITPASVALPPSNTLPIVPNPGVAANESRLLHQCSTYEPLCPTGQCGRSADQSQRESGSRRRSGRSSSLRAQAPLSICPPGSSRTSTRSSLKWSSGWTATSTTSATHIEVFTKRSLRGWTPRICLAANAQPRECPSARGSRTPAGRLPADARDELEQSALDFRGACSAR